MVLTKILVAFNKWFTEGRVPQYLKSSRVITLSKDQNISKYPEVGEIRTIAIAPALTKMYELCLHKKL